MLRRVVIGASLACLMGGAAYAVDEPAEGDDQCTQQLAAAEEAVQNKIDANTLSEEDTERQTSFSIRRTRSARKETSPGRPRRLPTSTRSWPRPSNAWGREGRRAFAPSSSPWGRLSPPFLDLPASQSLNPASRPRAGG